MVPCARKGDIHATLTFSGSRRHCGIALLAVVVSMTFASSPSGVTPTLLARGSYSDFKVASFPDNSGLFKAEAKGPIDVVVRRHDYVDGGSTGWHQHPYPAFITVVSGQLTFYDANDPSCTPLVVSAGGGYVDSGKVTSSATRAALRLRTSA